MEEARLNATFSDEAKWIVSQVHLGIAHVNDVYKALLLHLKQVSNQPKVISAPVVWKARRGELLQRFKVQLVEVTNSAGVQLFKIDLFSFPDSSKPNH
jgi:hypothetical protein